MAGSLILAGCVDDIIDDLVDDLTTLEIENVSVNSANAELLEDLPFTFTDGGVFHADLEGDATTLVFDTVTNGTGTFILTSGDSTASGDATFGSCDLTVTASDFAAADGPQSGDVIALPTCEYSVVVGIDDITNDMAPLQLTVENAEGDSATSGDADVDVEKLCSFESDEIPEAIEDEICPQ
jgi:hypothetical protein